MSPYVGNRSIGNDQKVTRTRSRLVDFSAE